MNIEPEVHQRIVDSVLNNNRTLDLLKRAGVTRGKPSYGKLENVLLEAIVQISNETPDVKDVIKTPGFAEPTEPTQPVALHLSPDISAIVASDYLEETGSQTVAVRIGDQEYFINSDTDDELRSLSHVLEEKLGSLIQKKLRLLNLSARVSDALANIAIHELHLELSRLTYEYVCTENPTHRFVNHNPNSAPCPFRAIEHNPPGRRQGKRIT